MKSQGNNYSLKKDFFRKEKGFALIAAVTLMVLLALISVALMTLASSVSRNSGRSKIAEDARAQAKLALQIALGRLQTEVGPDQRITANSSILSSENDEYSTQGISNPYILGVWNSWDTWLNRSNSKGINIQSTYDRGRQPQFRRWLISSANENSLHRWNSTTGGSTIGKGNARDKTKVLILGPGTVGTTSSDKEVYAGLVEVNSNKTKPGSNEPTGNRNYIAWWVSGEAQKVRVNLPKYSTNSSSPMDVLAHSWDTPTPDTDLITGLESFSNNLPSATSGDYDDKIRSIFTRGTLRLVTGNRGRNQAAEYFHDASFDSVGLITDVKFGGLKKDLSILLSQNSLADTNDFYETNTGDVGIRPYSNEDGNGNINISTRPMSSWKQLFYWYNLWDKETKQGQDNTSPIAWEGQNPHTRIAADPETGTVMNNRFTYLRQPILLKFYQFLGFGLTPHASINMDRNAIPGMDGNLGSRPIFVWWNPYNMPLEVGTDNRFLTAFSTPHRVLPCQANLMSFGASVYNLQECNFAPYAFNYTNRGFFDYGTIFRRTMKEKTYKFAPGEIKVFTHELANNTEAGQVAGGSLVLYRGNNGDKKFDGYTFTNQFADYEPTFTANDYNGTVFVVPIWSRYTVNVAAQWDSRTPSKYDEQDNGIRMAIASDYTSLRQNAANNASEESIYRLFLRRTSGDTNINFAIGAGTSAVSVPTSTSDLSNGKAIDRYFPSFFNINWLDERPYVIAEDLKVGSTMFYLQWPAWTSNTDPGQTDPQQNTFWVGYYGISVKGVHGPIDADSRYPTGSDQRAKIWQHSSPLFWGSQMPNPNEILRQYHPYQFEVRRRRDNRDYTQMKLLGGEIAGQIDKDPDGNAYFGHTDEDMITHLVAAELPIHPPFSLAGMANFRLTPGWFDDLQIQNVMSSEGKRAKRISYQSGVPGVGISNSFADPMIKPEEVFYSYSEQDPNLADYWDHGFMINDALWDSWFTSSLSRRPSTFGGSVISLQEVASSFVGNAFSNKIEADNMLPNKRFQLEKGMDSESTITQTLSGQTDKSWEKSATYLTIPGAFNINSTSIEAWTAFLNALKERKIVYTDKDGRSPQVLSGSGDGNDIYFTRFGVASSSESRYGQTMHRISIGQNKYSWSDLRKISAASAGGNGGDVRELAREIVKQVKKRGPFLSMSEFINRRLVNDSELGTVGALQSAIDNAGLNDLFNDNMRLDAFSKYNFPAASAGSIQTASPGYLIQSDVLAALGNTMTVRDDTFTVRAYGMVADASGQKLLGRAWCEAVVQRTMDYVDPTNDPEVPVYIPDMQSGELKNSALTQTNKTFGRKMKIISFRWLSPEEV